MRAVVVSSLGGPEVLEPRDLADPLPGPGEILIDVAASGVNYIDTYQRTGLYPMPMPFVPGVEGAGTVSALGENVTGFAVGDPVAWVNVPGGYAQKAVIPADKVIAVPSGVWIEDAAAVLLQGLTAHYLTHSTYPVQPGDVALVHAAAGGVGQLLTQMVKLLGGRVIGTVSTEEKEKIAREAGADEVLRYDDFATAAREFTGGAGVHVVYDGVGAATFEGSLNSLRPRGMMALYGQASGPVSPVDPQRLAAGGSLFLTRPSLGAYLATPEELRTRTADIFRLLASGALSVRIFQRYNLDDARKAHEDLESRRTTGKLLLLP
ncbi:quinone oxidoreductase family protein [Rhizohabitans arisaemae]|uniref:quinone oxidoreductase family protein n=1 Tax=Rhizohabitans arisaemae TaxID=2720610 RepID=UPI0024B0FD8F|nr:quinone oxidoreductase [Rhizohabitans arisaemae]